MRKWKVKGRYRPTADQHGKQSVRGVKSSPRGLQKAQDTSAVLSRPWSSSSPLLPSVVKQSSPALGHPEVLSRPRSSRSPLPPSVVQSKYSKVVLCKQFLSQMVSPNQVEKIKLYTTNLKDSGVGPETTKKLRVKYRQWWFYTTSYLVSLFHCSISMWYNTHVLVDGWLASST